MEKELQVVGFRIGNETFGVRISFVREIVRVPEITSVPSAPDYIEGVINLRGKIIPVMDLRKRFNEKFTEPDKKNRILVVEMDEQAHRPDRQRRVRSSENSALGDRSASFGFSGRRIDYVTGVGKLKGRLIILLDITKILQRGELRRLEEVSEPAPVPVGSATRN